MWPVQLQFNAYGGARTPRPECTGRREHLPTRDQGEGTNVAIHVKTAE
jgi:hypothetical protein